MSDELDTRPIPDWPGYYATDDGRIFSFRAQRSLGFGKGTVTIDVDDGRELKQFDRRLARGRPHGYRSVCLIRDGMRRNLYVHELVMLAFIGPRPPGWTDICHANGDRSDNRLANLRYGSRTENAADRDAHGHTLRGEAWRAAHMRSEDDDGHAFSDLLEETGQ